MGQIFIQQPKRRTVQPKRRTGLRGNKVFRWGKTEYRRNPSNRSIQNEEQTQQK